MALNTTPIDTRSLAELLANDDLDILVPEITEAYDEQLLSKKRACRARENTCVWLRLTIRDRDGNGEDLTKYGIQGTGDADSSSSGSSIAQIDYGSVKVRFREGSLMVSTTYQVAATVLDPENGVVICRIPDKVIQNSGIWFAEIGVLKPVTEELLFSDEVYVYVEHSAWTTRASGSVHGPPLIDDLRLALRDSSPFENELTEAYDYGIVEICHAAIRAVNFWNEQPPIISVAKYTTLSFPFREIWTRGTKLFLFQMAEEHYRRNHFKHSSGGVTTDDKNRHREYNQAWKEEFASYRQLVMHQKARINADQAYRSFGSGYGWR